MKICEIERTLKEYLTEPLINIVLNTVNMVNCSDDIKLLSVLRLYLTDKLISLMFPKLID